MTTDALFRISLKCVIKNNDGDLLLVKESGRELWGLPGGGMEHGETIRQAITRELNEEVAYTGNFTYRVVGLNEPSKLRTRDVWQVTIILEVTPDEISFHPGTDADEIAFMSVTTILESNEAFEQVVQAYANEPPQ